MRSVRERDLNRKSELAGDSDSAKRPYALAMRAPLWGRCGRVADALGLEQSTVQKWEQPHAPQHGPLWQLETIMRVAIEDGGDEHEALAPLRFLAERFGYALAPVLEVVGTVGLLRAASAAERQSSEAISTALEALSDGRVSTFERERIRKESDDAISTLRRLRAEAEALAAAGNKSA